MLPHARAASRVHERPLYTNKYAYRRAHVYGRAYNLIGPVRASQGSSTAIRGGNKDDRTPRYEQFLVHPGRRCVFPPRVQPRGEHRSRNEETHLSVLLLLL